MNKSHELTLNRWHKVAERLAAKASEAAARAKACFCETRVDGYAGEAQERSIREKAREAEAALAVHLDALNAAGAIRRALSEANSANGIHSLLAEQETLNRRAKVLREILEGQASDMIPAQSLKDYRPFSDSAKPAYFHGEGPKGAIPVRTLPAELEAALRKELESVQSALFSKADRAADINRQKIAIEISESAARAAGLE